MLWHKIGNSILKFFEEFNGAGFEIPFNDGEHEKKSAVAMVRFLLLSDANQSQNQNCCFVFFKNFMKEFEVDGNVNEE